MQLHTLSMTAFGPFPDTQRVDFDALGDAGLFLLHGATGAGKTSILDAVCFALYGQVPGARGAARSLHSDHAAPGTRPEVVLEATVRGRRIRLSRSPSWERPKHRGTGTTSEQARAHLEERRGDGWTTLSTRLDEIGHQVRTLLGLDVTQFCQVVLLPQGQFAEFLRADADRRRALLESLFDTERFADVERWLVERRKDSSRVLEEADQRLAGVLARVVEAGGGLVPEGEPPDAACALTWTADLCARAEERVAVLEEVTARSQTLRSDAARALLDGQQLHDAQQRHAGLRVRLAEVESRSAQRDAAVAQLAAARRVAPVVPLVVELARLDGALALASGEVLSRRQQLEGAGADPHTLSSIAPEGDGLLAVRRRSERTRAELGGLEQLVPVEAEARELARTITRLERDVVALDQQRATVERWLSSAGQRGTALRRAVDLAQAAAAGVEAARGRLADLATRLGAAGDRDRLDGELAEAEALRREAVDLAQAAREGWLDLRAARLEGMAAELAGGLRCGVGCPVCGSPDHPAPAAATAHAVTREQEDDAEQAVKAAEQARTTVEDGLGRLRADRAAAYAVAGSDTVAAIHDGIATARDELGALEEQAAGLEDARAALAAFENELAARSEEQLRLDEQARATRARAAETATRRATLQTRLEAARGNDPSVAARSARLAELVAHLDGLVDVVSEVQRLSSEVAAARSRALAAARLRGLDSLADVPAECLPEAELDEIEARRRRHDEEHATVTELLDDQSLAIAAAAAPPDLVALEVTATENDRRHTGHVGQLAAARERATALARLQAQLAEGLAARRPLAEAHATVDGLSRLAEGKSSDNRLRMSLSGYVLAARLEQVAAAASERLSRMSSGRYQLVHSSDAAGGRGRGGLHLRVLDAWTGADRDPATLSGGESFSASLSLALGLADVVSGEAGGSLLETLFVDEGFGTLDDETLDEVMAVLDDLRDGGRVVGLVSHVADLRQRIPVQLHVHKGRAGSTVRQ
jgi:exonuclease SbcC